MMKTITVKGVGNVSAKPDYITISMTVESMDSDYEKAMVFGFLVVLGEQFFSGLVGSSGNSRTALASLDDADFQMWHWHL